MKGVIFDLDGVIVDTAKYHFLAWKRLAERLAIPFTEKDNEQFKGVSRRRCLEILLEMGHMKVSESQVNAWLVEKNEDYLALIADIDETEILPGVHDAIRFFQENGIPLALGSASKNAIPILEKTGLRPAFKSVVDGTRVSKAKPDPEVFLLASKEIGVPPEECIVFEDARAGIEAAHNAGMKGIGIGNKKNLNNADFVFANFEEISRDFLYKLISNNSHN